MIKIYAHYNNLIAFNRGQWIAAKLQFVGQHDVELWLDLDDIVISYQTNGFTVRKRKWYEKLFNLKNSYIAK